VDSKWGSIAYLVWLIGANVSFIFLTLLDGYVYTWWNWIIALPVNAFLSMIWPLYYGLLRPLGF
jgi:hypothetical protein